MSHAEANRITKTLQLNDIDGEDEFIIKDADGFPVFKVDSQGTVKTRRGIERI